MYVTTNLFGDIIFCTIW